MGSWPTHAAAFWPFFTNARGAEIGDTNLENTKLAVLEPAQNPDPSPFNEGGAEIVTTNGSALMANVGPDGSVVPSGSVPNNGRISLYVVREGDTLSEIADMFNVSVNTIKWANDISNTKLISPGDTLLILPVSGVKHAVKKGDTLASLAKKYGADALEIAVFNGLEEGATLAVGETLLIPGGEIVAPKASSSSSGSVRPAGSGAVATVASGFFANPVPGAYISQGIHGYNGIDLAGVASGAPVYAAAGGTVIVARGGGGWNGGYGNYIVIDHGNGTQTLYAHLSSLAVGQGQSVSQGTHLGGIGRTGRATGNHLHFEVRGAKNPFAR